MGEKSDKNVKVEHFERFSIKFQLEFHDYLVNKKEAITMTPSAYHILIDEIVTAKKKNGQLLTSRNYRWLKAYNTVIIDNRTYY